MNSGAISGAAIAKRLASCNKSTRDRAVRLLSSWLPAAASAASVGVSDGDLVKIWKGLFYCVWHADKVPFQLDLINRLASLLESLDPPFSLRYLDAFLLTIRREWSGIDFLRLDKFYLLIRKFLHHCFLLLKKNDWNSELSTELVGILSEKSLLVVDKFSAHGVNYQIAEVFLEEIAGFLPVAPETLGLLLKPFIRVMEKSSDKVLVNKIKINVFDRLIENGEKFLNGERGGEVEKFGKIAFLLRFSEKFLEAGSNSETLQGNRKVLFGLHDRFVKLEKDFDKSGLEITCEHSCNGKLEEKHESLVEETAAADGNPVEKSESLDKESSKSNEGSDVRPLKKRKKGKKGSDAAEKKAKSKKKKNKSPDSPVESVEANDVVNGENVNGNANGLDNLLTFDESVMSNLQKQFEKVAAEAGMASPATPVNHMLPKKRKRAKSADVSVNGGSTAGKSGQKSVKKVRFSMKNNLIWKPHSPLPPQSLRLPPSATPRGSALKKGLSPGPIKETPSTGKRSNTKGSFGKKGRKSLKSVSRAVKRLRKLQGFSV